MSLAVESLTPNLLEIIEMGVSFCKTSSTSLILLFIEQYILIVEFWHKFVFYFSCLVVFPSQKIIDRINQIELKMVLSVKKK
jgi:hypothetical protein